MAAQTKTEIQTPMSKRAYKPNPVVQSRDAVKERRRDMFFKRVQKDRDDRRWEARGEQIQRLDFISSHKRWEAEKARQAPQLDDEYLEEEVTEDRSSSFIGDSAPKPGEEEAQEADFILEQEERELQALIALMENDQGHQNASSQYDGSDEEDYDQILIEYMANSDAQQPGFQDPTFDYADAMDISEG
ncbi:hypothetical protein K469DRAFT_688753 [Zopfia rhizophila CBS 207.26]|uniref:Uncharacterized protein n=1 Tax=Zopfia rhizophila CBS 207.26 TaxID=1314779 RepID=A0A6A6E2Y9_9PEZI|nr:hypothetical protein K469DRAFT_688753 [Zopfia rhizophila CBS 207.26]